MNPSTKLLLDELHKLFDEQEAKWDRRFTDLDVARDQGLASRGGAIPTPAATKGCRCLHHARHITVPPRAIHAPEPCRVRNGGDPTVVARPQPALATPFPPLLL